MIKVLFKSIFGSSNERNLKKIKPFLLKINALESSIKSLSDQELFNKTEEFRQKIKSGATLDEILNEAYAVLREAAYRAFQQRAYDVQIIGGIVLHKGNVAEMRTGEGKTLTAAFPSYLNAISGKGVHVITVNDYLAQRDAEKMKKLFSLLDISVGCNVSGMTKEQKDEAYSCDITYGTANEFGFDYLRDNMALSVSGRAQKELNFALIDEVDSVLIDEARTPLIISDANEESVDLYHAIANIPKLLKEGKEVKDIIRNYEEGDYYIDLKTNQVYLTEEGYKKSEEELVKLGILSEHDSLYNSKNTLALSILIATIKAHTIFHKNKHYIVSENGEVKIIDEHTGRIMEGRRWNDGIHQAIEAKEGVDIKAETITLATITLQNYFKQYKKLAGMTGTADTEAYEFNEIYHLNTIVIPTNRPIKRKDFNDKVFQTFNGKLKAVMKEVEEIHKKGQPILLGTSSIENNEIFYNEIKKLGLPVNVLNAKNHHLEADIIAQAGKIGAITVATNMAGRGTDIILGGNIEKELEDIKNNEVLSEETKLEKIEKLNSDWEKEHAEVIELGGLHVIGTERHESRRIDNQLRGRAGRQGDLGSSIFFASFEDDLLKPYAERARMPFKSLELAEDEALEGKLLTRLVANAQEKVEKMHYEIRKNLTEFDTTVSLQREVIYKFRNEILEMDIFNPEEKVKFEEHVDNIIDESIKRKLDFYIPLGAILETSDINGLIDDINNSYDIKLPITYSQQIANDVEGDYNSEQSFSQTLKPNFSENDLMNVNPFDEFIYGAIFDTNLIHEKITHYIKSILNIKLASADPETLISFKKTSLLQIIDRVWREHLTELDYVKKGIHLRGYAQKDPKQEFKREAFNMFKNILPTIEEDFTELMMKVQIQAAFEMNVHNQNLQKQLEEFSESEKNS